MHRLFLNALTLNDDYKRDLILKESLNAQTSVLKFNIIKYQATVSHLLHITSASELV